MNEHYRASATEDLQERLDGATLDELRMTVNALGMLLRGLVADHPTVDLLHALADRVQAEADVRDADIEVELQSIIDGPHD